MPWPLLQRAPARSLSLSCVGSLFPAKPSSQLLRTLTRSGCLFILALGLSIATVQAQSGPHQSGQYDKEIVTPTEVGGLGQRDGAALNELLAHIRVVGASPWIRMQGTGQITYGSDDTTPYSATLSILGVTGFRLDSKTATGDMSIRIRGRQGTIQEADGRKYPVPPNTAISGIIQFPQLRRADFPSVNESLIDRGIVTVDGVSLHCITVEYAAPVRTVGAIQVGMIATDLYFDPATHLLLKSVNKIRLDGAGNSEFLRVITYGDYRQVSGSMIPFRYVQTLDGQKQWTLQLSEVQLNPTLAPTYFAF